MVAPHFLLVGGCAILTYQLISSFLKFTLLILSVALPRALAIVSTYSKSALLNRLTSLTIQSSGELPLRKEFNFGHNSLGEFVRRFVGVVWILRLFLSGFRRVNLGLALRYIWSFQNGRLSFAVV
jgi:hypothetical protein